MEKIKWGIIGPGNIANNFADGLNSSYSGQLVGIASKNENFAASLGFKPSNVPIVIVMPDREIPGIIANA